MLRDIPGDTRHPLDPAMLVKDREHGGMDVAHAAVRPHDPVLLDDGLTAQDRLGGLIRALPVIGVDAVDPLAAGLDLTEGAAPDPLIGGADVLHLHGFSIEDPEHVG